MKRENLRKVVATVVAFGTSVMLALTFIFLACSIAFSRPSLELLTGKGYKEKVENEILAKLEGYAIPGGLPRKFFDEKLDRELLYKDIDRSVEGALKNESVTFESFTAATNQSILDYAAQSEIDVETEEGVKESIDELVNLCSSTYRRLVNSDIIKILAKVVGYLWPWCLIVVAVAAILSALLILAVIKIGGQNFLRIALGGAGVMLLMLPAYLLIFRNISSLGITSPSMYALITGVLYVLLGIMIAAALVFVAVANIPYERKKPEA